MWVKQCHVYHPPVITIFIGGLVTIPKWVVYGLVLPTLYIYIYWKRLNYIDLEDLATWV